MKTKESTLICIVGPTAIGKTNLSIQLANYFSTEILSADSRQFFKEMEIGTGVPSQNELSQAKHHFIQHISVKRDYNVGEFEKEAIEVLETIFKTHSKAILVGGSGLYQKAITEGLDVFPEIPLDIRTKIESLLNSEGIGALQNLLKKKDPEYYQQVELSNPRRVTRALEVIETSGEPYSTFLNQTKPKRSFNSIKIGLDAPREVIYNRIEKRVDEMIVNGLLEEAKSLYPFKHLNALQTVGYKELFVYFEGKATKTEAISEIKKNTRRFAKRQLTWFKKDPQIKWFHYETSREEIISYIKKNSLP
jgi:tRNA dimethylallyltransferase